jgi:CubicO group peptidase (beta-lactamase class C family)
LYSETDNQTLSTDLKLNQFIDSVKELHNKDLLDGEILIVQNDKELLHLISKDISSIENPQFMIGSISKQFFSVALLKALYDLSLSDKEEDKINEVKEKLNMPISYYLSENSEIWAKNMPSWAKDVSLYQLLTHTSGIENYTNCDEFWLQINPERNFFEVFHSPQEIIQLIKNKELLFPPGTKYYYSNTNYVMIAEIIEAVTNESASKCVEKLFNDLRLKYTSSPDKGRWEDLKLNCNYTHLVPQWKYDPTGDQRLIYPQTHFEDISVAKGAGSIISTAKDLLQWNLALHKNKSVLPSSLYDIFIAANLEGYGCGIVNVESKLGTILLHDGSIGTYRTFLSYFPDLDLSVIVLSHISYDDKKIEEEFDELLLSLKETISDENEREEKVITILKEKYPSNRGRERIRTIFGLLINPDFHY